MLILRAFIPALSCWIVVSHPLAKFEQFSSSKFTRPEPGDAEAKKAPSTMSRSGNELLSNSSKAARFAE